MAYGKKQTRKPRTKKSTYARKPRSKKVTKTRMPVTQYNRIMKAVYTWKSFREANNNTTLALSGNISSALRGLIFELSDIPFYNTVNPAAPAQLDTKQARQTTNPYVSHFNVGISLRCTHNHAVTIRFLCFRNNGWQEPLSWTTSTYPVLATLDNLFVNFLDKSDETTSPDGIRLPIQQFNGTLCQSRKDMYLNRVKYMRPLQGVGSGGEVADSLSLRNYNFRIPVNQIYKYEDRILTNSEINNIKTGRVFFVMLVGVADPSNTANAGDMVVDTRFSTIFKENV